MNHTNPPGTPNNRRSEVARPEDVDGSPLRLEHKGADEDTGVQARERLTVKQKALRVASMIRLFIVGFIVIFLLAAGGYGYYQWDKRLVATTTDTRSCSVKIGDGDNTITGTRSYTYKFTEFMGYQFRDTRKVDEKTQIAINGTPITIIAMSGKNYTPIHVGMGEKGVQIIPKADMYAFTLDGKQTTMVEYRAFCR